MLRRALGVTAATGPVAFTIAWISASATRPGYDPWRSDISALAALDAPQPWITTTGKLLLAAAILALAVGLAITLTGREAAVGVGALTAAGLAMAAVAAAREDCDTSLAACVARQQAGLASWHHNLHGIASGLYLMANLGAPIILALSFRTNPSWRSLATYSVVTTVTGLALLVAYVAMPDAWTGLAQRAFVSVPAAWTAVLGAHLIRCASRTNHGHGLHTSADRPEDGNLPARIANRG